MNYIPSTQKEQSEMLAAIGKKDFAELFSSIPGDIKLDRPLDIPDGLSESEVLDFFTKISEKNTKYKIIFRGYGAYNHFIPSVVKNLASRSEFVTAYTPYQPEMSQGILRAIFEYQSLICRLTGMDASNASVYDGASAAAEAIHMCADKKKNKVLISATVKKHNLAVIETYCSAFDVEIVIIPEKDGKTDIDALKNAISEDTACVYAEQPNMFGIVEDYLTIGQIAHEKGAKFILGTYPFALGILKNPSEYGADIAVGEGQSLGLPLSFGGAYLGFLAVKKELMRKLSGRIVGETSDKEGRKAYVLTMQAREQHIRREKASSSICSNEALCALTAAIYLSTVGAEGLFALAKQCMSKARYFADKLCETGKFKLKYNADYFNEFVTESNTDSFAVEKILSENGILSGYPLNTREILWCVTERNTKEEMDKVCDILNGGAF